MLSFDEVNSKLWHTEADVFLPCAASRLVTREQVAAMLDHGLQMIACGANVPFADEEIFYGPICEYADTRLTLIPDFIANCGMARVFAYLMDSDAVITDEAIFADVSHTIKHALKDIWQNSQNRTGLTALALKKAITGTL
jgi:glutamate dehydrogenase/leucine dehydrogenase